MTKNQLPFEKAKRKTIVRKQAETNPKLGCKPEERPTSEIIRYGIVNIDKPPGPTSHQVSDFIQKILKISKSGHSGTLDPGVTGVLPVALDKSTRIVQTLLVAGKEYVGVMHIHKDVPEEKLRKTCSSFVGKIRQLPPIKSAVKRQLRTRTIYYFEILEIDGKDVLFRTGTQAGTYIRKLCFDIGKKLGCGAHMSELKRTKAGPFDESTLSTLQDLTDAFWYYKNENNDKFIRKIIQPVENAVSHLSKIWVLDSTVDSLCHGIDLKIPGISKLNEGIQKNDTVAIMTLKDELVALGTAISTSKQMQEDKKGIAVKTNKVFMVPGTYKNG